MKKIKNTDLVGIKGFYGNTALVDKKIQQQTRKKPLATLLEKGFYKEAIQKACISDTEEDKLVVINFFKEKKQLYIDDFSILVREFGVLEAALSQIDKVKKL